LIIYFFPKYTRAGASSRYRSYQYLEAIESAGHTVKISPLFEDAYLLQKYEKGSAGLTSIFSSFARRIWGVVNVPRGASVFIEYELLPYCPALLERWLAWRGCHLVVDYDDALFHQYDAHRFKWVRLLLGGKIASVIRIASTVIAGNNYLANYARHSNAERVYEIPTVIDLSKYRVKAGKGAPQMLTIGWIGSPSTARYLNDIAPALAEFCKNRRARVCLIGSGPINLPGVPVELIDWREDTEIEDIRRFDVGIMPLPDEPWARGKCGFKLIQYMACGLPVVASPVGVNSEIVEDKVSGFLATSTSEWVDALNVLLDSVEMRRKMGAAGRQRVQEKYCLTVTAPKLVEVLEQCAA
jgi:glycosyltransferase involved in cell wall biosynthesis